ncbi:hypothetical protein HDU77_004778 [Chytriomyces hyalinus]|nr:hypothetical protein HDU77_004778 [Chytriomyces hyalinus]
MADTATPTAPASDPATISAPTSPVPPLPVYGRESRDAKSLSGLPAVAMQRLSSSRRLSMIDASKLNRTFTNILKGDATDAVTLDAKDTVQFSSTSLPDRMAVVCHGLHKHGFVDQLFSDITVHILGKDYNLHRITLVNNPFFAIQMLQVHDNAPVNGKVDLTIEIDDPNISHDALRVVFSRLYGYFEDRVTTANLPSLLATAYFFQDADLCEMCADFIKTIQFTPENSIFYLNYASNFDYGETTELLLRHALIFFCRESVFNKELAEETLPKLEFSWLARILQSDALYISSEFARFEFIEAVLRKKLASLDLAALKETVSGMTNHVLALGRLPPRAIWSANEGDVTGSTPSSAAGSPALPHGNVVFLGKLAAITAPSLPNDSELSIQDLTDAAINLLAKGIIFAHIPRNQYDKVRAETVVPGFVFDRHFRIHHDLIRLVETCPKGIQKLGISYHYDRKNVLSRKDGEAETFWENIMGTVYAHDLLEMPPFRFSVEFGRAITTDSGKQGGSTGIMKVLKGAVGDNAVSKGVVYAGSLWSIRIEKQMVDGVSQLALSLVRKPASKDISTYSDTRPEVSYWCKIIAYCHVSDHVTEAYAFENISVSTLSSPSSILHGKHAELFKELYMCGSLDSNATALRLAVVLGVL